MKRPLGSKSFTPLEKARSLTGFTIVEVLTSTLLITLVVCVFFSCLILTFNYLRRVRELRTSSLILQEEVSLVRGLKFADIQSLGGNFSSDTMASLGDASGTIIKSPYEGHGAAVKMTFAVDWTTFEGKSAHKSVVTLMTERGINKR